MRLWFWGWLIAAVAIALVSALVRDRSSAPFALGAACAAVFEAAGIAPEWQWIAFVAVSSVAFIALNRRRYRPRHDRRTPGHQGKRPPIVAD